MTWSSDSQRFVARGCDQVVGAGGSSVRIVVYGDVTSGTLPPQERFEALLFAADANRDGAVPAVVGRVEKLTVKGTAWSLIAVFDLPAEAFGDYQLVVGWRDPPAPSGEYVLVDTAASSHLFRVT
jgi:hypothetical protein